MSINKSKATPDAAIKREALKSSLPLKADKYVALKRAYEGPRRETVHSTRANSRSTSSTVASKVLKTASPAGLLARVNIKRSPSRSRAAAPARKRRKTGATSKGMGSKARKKVKKRRSAASKGRRKDVTARLWLVSPQLSQLLGGESALTRSQATVLLWKYIKENSLQAPHDGRIVVCDENLRELFGGVETVHILEIQRKLNPHLRLLSQAEAASLSTAAGVLYRSKNDSNACVVSGEASCDPHSVASGEMRWDHRVGISDQSLGAGIGEVVNDGVSLGGDDADETDDEGEESTDECHGADDETAEGSEGSSSGSATAIYDDDDDAGDELEEEEEFVGRCIQYDDEKHDDGFASEEEIATNGGLNKNRAPVMSDDSLPAGRQAVREKKQCRSKAPDEPYPSGISSGRYKCSTNSSKAIAEARAASLPREKRSSGLTPKEHTSSYWGGQLGTKMRAKISEGDAADGNASFASEREVPNQRQGNDSIGPSRPRGVKSPSDSRLEEASLKLEESPGPSMRNIEEGPRDGKDDSNQVHNTDSRLTVSTCAALGSDVLKDKVEKEPGVGGCTASGGSNRIGRRLIRGGSASPAHSPPAHSAVGQVGFSSSAVHRGGSSLNNDSRPCIVGPAHAVEGEGTTKPMKTENAIPRSTFRPAPGLAVQLQPLLSSELLPTLASKSEELPPYSNNSSSSSLSSTAEVSDSASPLSEFHQRYSPLSAGGRRSAALPQNNVATTSLPRCSSLSNNLPEAPSAVARTAPKSPLEGLLALRREAPDNLQRKVTVPSLHLGFHHPDSPVVSSAPLVESPLSPSPLESSTSMHRKPITSSGGLPSRVALPSTVRQPLLSSDCAGQGRDVVIRRSNVAAGNKTADEQPVSVASSGKGASTARGPYIPVEANSKISNFSDTPSSPTDDPPTSSCLIPASLDAQLPTARAAVMSSKLSTVTKITAGENCRSALKRQSETSDQHRRQIESQQALNCRDSQRKRGGVTTNDTTCIRQLTSSRLHNEATAIRDPAFASNSRQVSLSVRPTVFNASDVMSTSPAARARSSLKPSVDSNNSNARELTLGTSSNNRESLLASSSLPHSTRVMCPSPSVQSKLQHKTPTRTPAAVLQERRRTALASQGSRAHLSTSQVRRGSISSSGVSLSQDPVRLTRPVIIRNGALAINTDPLAREPEDVSRVLGRLSFVQRKRDLPVRNRQGAPTAIRIQERPADDSQSRSVANNQQRYKYDSQIRPLFSPHKSQSGTCNSSKGQQVQLTDSRASCPNEREGPPSTATQLRGAQLNNLSLPTTFFSHAIPPPPESLCRKGLLLSSQQPPLASPLILTPGTEKQSQGQSPALQEAVPGDRHQVEIDAHFASIQRTSVVVEVDGHTSFNVYQSYTRREFNFRLIVYEATDIALSQVQVLSKSARTFQKESPSSHGQAATNASTVGLRRPGHLPEGFGPLDFEVAHTVIEKFPVTFKSDDGEPLVFPPKPRPHRLEGNVVVTNLRPERPYRFVLSVVRHLKEHRSNGGQGEGENSNVKKRGDLCEGRNSSGGLNNAGDVNGLKLLLKNLKEERDDDVANDSVVRVGRSAIESIPQLCETSSDARYTPMPDHSRISTDDDDDLQPIAVLVKQSPCSTHILALRELRLMQRQDMSKWSDREVTVFAKSLSIPGFAQRCGAFAVDGASLASFTESDLTALGVTAPFLIKRVLAAIRALCEAGNRQATPDPTSGAFPEDAADS